MLLIVQGQDGHASGEEEPVMVWGTIEEKESPHWTQAPGRPWLPGSPCAPVPGLSTHTINTCCLTRLIGGQNECRIKKKKESRIRFTGH